MWHTGMSNLLYQNILLHFWQQLHDRSSIMPSYTFQYYTLSSINSFFGPLIVLKRTLGGTANGALKSLRLSGVIWPHTLNLRSVSPTKAKKRTPSFCQGAICQVWSRRLDDTWLQSQNWLQKYHIRDFTNHPLAIQGLHILDSFCLHLDCNSPHRPSCIQQNC